jgi:hypothetical protein
MVAAGMSSGKVRLAEADMVEAQNGRLFFFDRVIWLNCLHMLDRMGLMSRICARRILAGWLMDSLPNKS